MEIKYEAVFGDQSLFDSTVGTINEDALIILAHNTYKVFFQNIEDAFQWIRQDTSHRSKCINKYAMRRIIRTPTWTVADQKAGRLPEVGCKVEYFNNNEHDNTEVTAQWRNGDELEILRHQNKNKAFVVFNARTERSSDLIVQCMKPIETPAEKAQRLENEWVNKAWSETAVFDGVAQDEHDRLRIHLRHIYKAQLSGELQAPKGGE